ncbi:hypothetical protein ACFOHY_21090 [Rhizobium rosettiformans]|uniref:hypothetical protein n=1 Tax=Rhizobium rosettiformans TaxID=1368430 RepID=UPI00360B855F
MRPIRQDKGAADSGQRAVTPLNKTGAVAKKSPVGNFKYRSHPSISRLMVSQ